MRGPGRVSRQLELRFASTLEGAERRRGKPGTAPPRVGAAAARSRGTHFVITSALGGHRSNARVQRMLRYCLGFFPELEGHAFGVGVTRQALGLCSLEDFAIWLNPHALTLHTIAHELTHLLQARGLVPNGERACDVHALARHPSLNDARPNYLEVPETLYDERDRTRAGWSGVIFASARGALEERAGGRRTYIRWFEDQIHSLAAARPIAAL